MLDLLDFDRLEEILVLIIPGFVSLKVWTLINPTARLKLADYLLDIIAFSALNFAALSWLLAITTDSPLWLRIIVGIGVFIGAPAAWPVLLRATLNWRVLRGRIIHPDPLAWDYFFRQGHSCFVLVHLKDGKVIGGLYNGESFASSYPESQDIYPRISDKGWIGRGSDQNLAELARYTRFSMWKCGSDIIPRANRLPTR